MEPEEPEPKEKEYRLLKGEQLPLAEVMLDTFPIPVQRIENIPGPYKVPRYFMVVSAGPGYPEYNRAVQIWDPHTQATRLITLNVAHKLNVLRGRQSGMMRNEYASYSSKNFAKIFRRIDGMTIGADPEIFMTRDKDVLPAWKFLGSKAKPTKTPPCGGGNPQTTYWDGFQTEFTTNPHSCLAYFTDEIQNGLKTIWLAGQAHDKKARFSTSSVLPVDPEILDTAKEEHVEFGCMPSRNVYGLEGNKISGRMVPMRFAGGHVHLGIPKQYRERIPEMVKSLDRLLGLPCVSFFSAWDSPVRREFYGLPGEYRTPPHGLEYRTLSNAWLIHPVLTHMVYEIARVATFYGAGVYHHFKDDSPRVMEIIQKSDVGAARAYMTEHKAAYLDILSTIPPFKENGDLAFNLLLAGAHTMIKEPENFEKNWNLDTLAHGYWMGHSDGLNKNWRLASYNLSRGIKI